VWYRAYRFPYAESGLSVFPEKDGAGWLRGQTTRRRIIGVPTGARNAGTSAPTGDQSAWLNTVHRKPLTYVKSSSRPDFASGSGYLFPFRGGQIKVWIDVPSSLIGPDNGNVWQKNRGGHEKQLDRPRGREGHGQDETDQPDAHLDEVGPLTTFDVVGEGDRGVRNPVDDLAVAPESAP